MKENLTKEKGDIGLCAITFDLTKKGYNVLLPVSEHLPFDLVAYKDGKFIRIQVKYRAIVNGSIEISFRSVYSNSKGSHVSFYDKNDIDLFAVYCPDNNMCYYINHNNFNKSVKLRVDKAKETFQGSTENMNFAENFLNINLE